MTLNSQPMLFNERFTVFLEDVIDPTKRSTVAHELAELYGINEKKFERLLSNYKKPITKPISYQQASKLQWYLKKLSVQTSLVAEEDLFSVSKSWVESETRQRQTGAYSTPTDQLPLYGSLKDEAKIKLPILSLLYVCLYGCLLFFLSSTSSLFVLSPTRQQVYIPNLNVDLSDYRGQNLVLGSSLAIILIWSLTILWPIQKTTSRFLSFVNHLKLPMIIIFILLICVELASLLGVFS